MPIPVGRPLAVLPESIPSFVTSWHATGEAGVAHAAFVACPQSSHVSQRWVFPDILISRGDQEAPPRWQCQVRQHVWAYLSEVTNVDRLEEAWIVGQMLARPDVPAGSTFFWGMTETVDRVKTLADVPGDTDLQIRWRCQGLHAKPVAELSLCWSREVASQNRKSLSSAGSTSSDGLLGLRSK